MQETLLAIAGGTILDGTGKEPVADGAVLIRGDRIADLGPRAEVSLPADAHVVDASGQTVLPGLVDLHMHSTHPLNHARYVKHGVTSVRFAGGQQAAIRELRERIERDELSGPRVFSCGPLIDQHPAAYPHSSIELRDAKHAAQAVGELIERDGLDALILTQRVTPPVLSAVIQAAHSHNTPVTGQTWLTSGREAALLGIDGLENTSRIPEVPTIPPDLLVQVRSVPERLALLARLWNTTPPQLLTEVLQVMAEHHVVWTPTLVVFEYFARVADADRELESTLATAHEEEITSWRQLREVFAAGWTPEQIQETLDAIERIKDAVAEYHALGGRIATGSDLTFGGPSLHREMRLLRRAGLSAVEVIRAATSTCAQALRREDKIGSLEVGRRADLLIVDGDPLTDLRVLETPAAVLLGGRCVAGRFG